MGRVHAAAGLIAMALIAVFWTATAVSELTGAYVVAVKTLIPWGLLVLIPSIVLAGGGGFAAARGRTGGVVGKKQKRMPIIAANGVLVLIPSALFLAAKARGGEFDGWFYAMQSVELVAGGVNLWLLGQNARDGLRMTTLKRRQARSMARTAGQAGA
jgi:hypothetical protein